ncbi:MAG: endo alpha-1,4 polygalactosaminidase [Phycisphaerales bacterium]
MKRGRPVYNSRITSAILALVAPLACAQHQDLLYVLQPDTLTVQQLADADVDWLILEPTVNGDLASSFTAQEIEQIRTGGACPKKILAYLSVGEAESYRDYFDASWLDANNNPIPGTAPAWLGPTNPDWEGNYKVRYWMPDWQHLIVGTDTGPHTSPYDAIIDAGFDGVYLDIINAYDFWSSPDGIVERPRAQARSEMIDFVEEIARHARVVRGVPNFMVFPQGGADIIRDDNDQLDQETADYFAAISGIGREDVWFDELSTQIPAETQYTLDQLREYKNAGKVVLITDYLINRSNQSPANNNTRAQAFRTNITNEGFVGYCAYNDRALDAIVSFSGPGWDISQPEPGCAPSPCPADLNNDGLLNFFDVSAFLSAFNTQSPLADFTNDGLYNFFDVSAFLSAFNAGCP